MAKEGRRDAKILGLVLTAVLGLVLVVLALGGPLIQDLLVALNQGVGLKSAAVWSFAATVVFLLLFAFVWGLERCDLE